MTKDLDFTQGSISKKILLFSLPLMAGNIFQQLYNVVDTLIVGRFLGEAPLAAVGSAYTLMIFITSILIGLTMGSGVYFSICHGQKNTARMKQSIYISFLSIGALSLFLNAISYIFLEEITRFMQIPADVASYFRDYLLWIFSGIIAVFLYNYFAALLRAVGNSLIPLVFLTNNAFLKDKGLAAPQSWNDLLDPAYKNGLQMADARTSGTATERIYSLVKVFGEDGAFDYQKKLHQNVQMYTKSGAGGAMPIATGQAASGIFYIVDALEIQQQGHNVVISYPKEGVTFGIEATGVLKGAKNMESAKKFVDWAASKAFAQLIVEKKINYIPTRTDVTVTNPALDVSKVKLFETDVAWKGANRKAYVDRWINEVIR